MEHPYPIGPPSLYQLEYARETIRYRQIHNFFGRTPNEDPTAVAINNMINGIYPTFGHIDNSHGRWYNDLWGAREKEIAISRGYN